MIIRQLAASEAADHAKAIRAVIERGFNQDLLKQIIG